MAKKVAQKAAAVSAQRVFVIDHVFIDPKEGAKLLRDFIARNPGKNIQQVVTIPGDEGGLFGMILITD